MKKIMSVLTVALSLMVLGSTGVWAVELESTDQGRKDGTLQSDAPSVDDPYMNKNPSQKDYNGNPLTQKPYDATCKTDECDRAAKRQLNPNTTWRDDVKSGAKTGGY